MLMASSARHHRTALSTGCWSGHGACAGSAGRLARGARAVVGFVVRLGAVREAGESTQDWLEPMIEYVEELYATGEFPHTIRLHWLAPVHRGFTAIASAAPRVRVVLADPGSQPAAVPGPVPAVRLGNLEIRADEFEVLVDERRVGLTVREFELFQALADQYDRVVPRHVLYERVWGGPMAHRERSVDVFVRKVRGKLAVAAPQWTYIHTHFGVGYRLTPEDRGQHEPAV